ncbi:MAG: hypothetical protein AAF989_07430 [Planctomycetota bacterium]
MSTNRFANEWRTGPAIQIATTDDGVAKDSPNTTDSRPIRDLLRQLIAAPAVLAMLWPVILLCAGYLAWQMWGAEHYAMTYHGVDAQKIQVTSPPSSIEAKVMGLVDQVYEDTAMDQLSLLDSQASAKIASAFSMNPWVRDVISVRKMPGGTVDVRLKYREPVAAVFVDGENCEKGWYTVDSQGILLPNESFSRSEMQRIPNILIPGYCPKANQAFAGSLFGDERVKLASLLAEFLAPVVEHADVRVIAVYGDSRGESKPQFELLLGERADLERFYLGETDSLQRVFWGSAPGMEEPGEPTALMKAETLVGNQLVGDDLRMAQRRMPVTN